MMHFDMGNEEKASFVDDIGAQMRRQESHHRDGMFPPLKLDVDKDIAPRLEF